MLKRKTLFAVILMTLLLGAAGCDADPECDVAYYGPQPCTSSAECEETNGEGWYCDRNHPVGPEGCGNTWDLCVQDEE